MLCLCSTHFAVTLAGLKNVVHHPRPFVTKGFILSGTSTVLGKVV